MPNENNAAQTVYRIRNWVKYFENNRSRELKKPWWVQFPDFLSDDGYAELLDHPNGAAHYGVWAICVQIAGRSHFYGSLVRDGGAPHTPESLSRICRIPAGLVREACGRLAAIGWLEQVTVSKDTYLDGAENLRDTRVNGAPRPHKSRHFPATEERRGEETIKPNPPPSPLAGGTPTESNGTRYRGRRMVSRNAELAQAIYNNAKKREQEKTKHDASEQADSANRGH